MNAPSIQLAAAHDAREQQPVGLFERFWGGSPLLGPLARIGDGAKDVFVGGSAAFGGFVLAPAGMVLVSPVIAPLIGFDGMRQAFGTSFRGGQLGVGLAGHGFRTIGRGFVQGFDQAGSAVRIMQVGRSE